MTLEVVREIMNRRKFIKTVAATGASAFLNPMDMFGARADASPAYFALHQFIEEHPNAVFVKHTNVSIKTDSEAKKQEGIELAREIFTLQDTPGIPLSHMIAIKPNLTCVLWTGETADSEEGMGMLTDCDFMEGLVEGMKEIGLPSDKMYIREGNWAGGCPSDCWASPYIGVAERTGVHMVDFPTGRTITELTLETLEEGTEVTWMDCPNGVVFKRIAYIAPFNQPDSWLLNISKFKAHDMGMTLCVKNLQGTCIHPHIHFCEGVARTRSYPGHILQDFQADFEEHIEELYYQHLAAGIPRWDRDMAGRGRHSGYGMEVWAQRTCDSLSVTNTGFNIIEGIYGRNGNAFMEGPGPNGEAQDFMTNVLIFGKDPFQVDIIGYWLSGHDPRNVGLFHIARERGLCDNIDPASVPVYLWQDGEPELISLQEFEQFPIVTPYLRQDYGGQSEEHYHLLNEPYTNEMDSCTVNLSAGWNLISTRIQPVYSSIGAILASILQILDCVWAYNAAEHRWLRYSLDGSLPANGIDNMETGLGYWVNVKQAGTLNIQGVSTSGAIPLNQGWNLVGYNHHMPRDVEECISTIECNSIWTYDQYRGGWLGYDPDNPALNKLELMEPEKGYWINVKEECMWDVSL